MAAAALFLTAALAADGTEEQCPQPTNVRIITEPTVISVTQWDGNVAPMTFYPGSLIWDDMGDAYTYYIEYFRRSDGGDGTYTPIFNSYCSDYYYTLWSVDQAELLTGDYYAEVTAKRVDDTASPSLPAQTQIWHYTRTAQLDCPTGLAWDGMTATCGAVEGADNYNFCVYFSETEDGEYIWNHINYLSDTPQRDLRNAVDEQGNGYYYFTVVAESDDITVALDSEVSVHSPIYHRDTPQLPMPTGFRVVTEEEIHHLHHERRDVH